MVIWKFPKTSLTRKLAWGAIGGSITGFQNFLKDSLTIYDVMKENGDSSLPAIFFLFMGLAMLTSFMGLLCLAACMKRFDATYSSSMFVVSFVISASLMSAVHYQTFQHLGSIDDDILYPMGLLVLLWGAAILIKPSAICFTDEIDLSEEESNSDSSGCPPGRRGNRERLLS